MAGCNGRPGESYYKTRQRLGVECGRYRERREERREEENERVGRERRGEKRGR
jgi:hypothetical protein